MSKLVITSIGPASSVQDGGRPGRPPDVVRFGVAAEGAAEEGVEPADVVHVQV